MLSCSDGYNLSDENCGGLLTGPGDLTNIEAMLGALQRQWGPTLTHSLLPGSAAINAGDSSFTAGHAIVTVKRGPGFDRVVNSAVSILAAARVVGGTYPMKGNAPAETPSVTVNAPPCSAAMRTSISQRVSTGERRVSAS